ncbi:hypothetical protein L9F63_005266, partial [Diploptera punctata]
MKVRWGRLLEWETGCVRWKPWTEQQDVWRPLRLQQKICNCRPLEFNTRLLEVASSVGAKLLVRTVRVRLSRIYQSLGDEEQQAVHERLAQCLEEELELQCGACNLPFGLEADSLEALPCSHILHARCAHDILKRRDKKKKRLCPDCHRSVSSRLYLYCDDPHNLNQHRSTFSLASLSLRASSLTLNSHQATSLQFRSYISIISILSSTGK